MISAWESVRDSLGGFSTCVITNIYGDDLGLLGSLWGGDQVYVYPPRKVIDGEKIEIERSLNRQASKAIPHCGILPKE